MSYVIHSFLFRLICFLAAPLSALISMPPYLVLKGNISKVVEKPESFPASEISKMLPLTLLTL